MDDLASEKITMKTISPYAFDQGVPDKAGVRALVWKVGPRSGDSLCLWCNLARVSVLSCMWRGVGTLGL